MGYSVALAVRGAVLISALWCLTGEAAPCNSRRPIDVRASGEPLADVIDRIAVRCGFDVRSTHDLRRTVDVRYEHLPVADVLRRLLRRNSYLLLSDTGGVPLTLMIFGTAPVRHHEAPKELQRIRADLTDVDADRRVDAVLDLVDVASADIAIPLLRGIANDSDPSVRAAAEAVLDGLSPTE